MGKVIECFPQSQMGFLSFFLLSASHSINQTSGAETQVRVERMEKLQTDLDTLNFQDSTLGQQMEQFQQAVSRAKDELEKMM